MSRSAVLMFVVLVMVLLALSAFSFPKFKILSFGFVGPEFTQTRVLFVGDIMLGRYVETLIKERGPDYPFAGLDPLQNRHDYVVGNFEAPISKNHKQTKADVLDFSIATTSILALPNYISILSLANNHTFDSGEEDLFFTRDFLKEKGVSVFGDPNLVNEQSVTFISHDGQRIALIAINAVTDTDVVTASNLISKLELETAMQIVYIHWGEEYVLRHNSQQETLAKSLIDSGADAIIGHHPHVIQDIDIYKGAPIFYSLGNFVFDQYFNDDVQVGLGVELTLVNSDISYRLVPFTSKKTESSPQLMTVNERRELLSVISEKSSPNIAEKLKKSGTIYIADVLASL